MELRLCHSGPHSCKPQRNTNGPRTVQGLTQLPAQGRMSPGQNDQSNVAQCPWRRVLRPSWAPVPGLWCCSRECLRRTRPDHRSTTKTRCNQRFQRMPSHIPDRSLLPWQTFPALTSASAYPPKRREGSNVQGGNTDMLQHSSLSGWLRLNQRAYSACRINMDREEMAHRCPGAIFGRLATLDG